MSRNPKLDRKRRAAFRKEQAKLRDRSAGRCGVCGKRRYLSETAAMAAMLTIPGARRVYRCNGGWHVTSMGKLPGEPVR